MEMSQIVFCAFVVVSACTLQVNDGLGIASGRTGITWVPFLPETFSSLNEPNNSSEISANLMTQGISIRSARVSEEYPSSYNEDHYVRTKRNDNSLPYRVTLDEDDEQNVGQFEGSKVTLFLKAGESFRHVKVKLHLKSYLILNNDKEQVLSAKDLGIDGRHNKWHKLEIEVFTEGGRFLGGKWRIHVTISGDDGWRKSPVLAKPACVRRPIDEVTGIDVIASGQSEWRHEKPPGFFEGSTGPSKDFFKDNHSNAVVIAISLFVVLVLLASVALLLRFIAYKKGNADDKVSLQRRKRKTDGNGSPSSRPESAYSTENSLYGVII